MRLTLPELDTIRDNPEASPERRTRNRARAKSRLHARNFFFKKRSPGIVALCGDAHALTRLSRGRV